MKPTVSNGNLYVYISREEIEQMIKEKLFMLNEPINGVSIRCNDAEVSIPLVDNNYD